MKYFELNGMIVVAMALAVILWLSELMPMNWGVVTFFVIWVCFLALLNFLKGDKNETQ